MKKKTNTKNELIDFMIHCYNTNCAAQPEDEKTQKMLIKFIKWIKGK